MNDMFDLENSKATSLLINRITYEGWDSGHLTTRSNLLHDIITESRYDSIREMPEFKAILEKLL